MCTNKENTYPRVVGKIAIPENTNQPCICDNCGCQVDDSWGDPRIQIIRNGKTLYICEGCEWELFEQSY